MRRSRLGAARWTFVTLGVALLLAAPPPAAAQDVSALRVTVAAGGRDIFDGLLDTIVSRAGLSGRLAVRYVPSLNALRDFCRNAPDSSPDMVLTTHPLHGALASECHQNRVYDVASVELARNALVLAVRSGSTLTRLTSRQVYRAVAREVAYRDEFVRNTATRWADVDPSLPVQDIRFQLPMREEGSRATFDALVLQGGCRNESAVKQIYDAEQRTRRCVMTRSDRVRELPRPQAVKALLDAPIGTVGVLSYTDVVNSGGQFVALEFDGVVPNDTTIRTILYDFSTSFWLYARRGTQDVERIVEQAQSDTLTGPDGLLASAGLVPLDAQERAAQRHELTANDDYRITAMLNWLAGTLADTWRMVGITGAQPEAMPHSMDFTALMDIAGYRIVGLHSSIGLIPDAGMSFGIAREMSDADQMYLERIMRRDALARPGIFGAVQRRIIRSITEAREVGSFEVSKVDISFLPLPKVSLLVTPKGSGPATADSDGGGDAE